MYSYIWSHEGYQKLNDVMISDILNFCYWKKQSGELVGITLNFEHAEDVQINVCYNDWVAFLSKELRLGQEMCNQEPAEYLKNISCSELEERLRFHGIPYQKEQSIRKGMRG